MRLIGVGDHVNYIELARFIQSIYELVGKQQRHMTADAAVDNQQSSYACTNSVQRMVSAVCSTDVQQRSAVLFEVGNN